MSVAPPVVLETFESKQPALEAIVHKMNDILGFWSTVNPLHGMNAEKKEPDLPERGT